MLCGALIAGLTAIARRAAKRAASLVRSVLVREIRPSQRARILMLDNSTCVLCHRNDLELDIGHLISVHDGRALGLTDAELNSDENLAAMCSPCNSGVGRETLPLRIVFAVLRARTARGRSRPA